MRLWEKEENKKDKEGRNKNGKDFIEELKKIKKKVLEYTISHASC